MTSDEQHVDEPEWVKKIIVLFLEGRKQRALRKLDRVIEGMPLFWTTPDHQVARRRALALRTFLLLHWKKVPEAIAWLCLECYLDKNNMEARARRDQLLASLGWIPEGEKSSPVQTSVPGVTPEWGEVRGMFSLRAQLEEQVVAPFLNPGAYQKYGLHPPNGVLFHGPPGCGKSYLAEALAKRIAVRFVSVKPGDLASIYVHGTQGMISELFRNARKNAPCVLFLDEFDAMAPKRSAASLSHHYGAEVDELLAQLPDLWKARVLVIAATNQLENLDGAVIRPGRFDLKIWIGPPDLESRTDFFRCELKDRFTEGDLFSDQLALATDGATFSEMRRILEVAGFAASRKERGITQEDCLTAIKEVLG